jgi:hypothetical protein
MLLNKVRPGMNLPIPLVGGGKILMGYLLSFFLFHGFLDRFSQATESIIFNSLLVDYEILFSEKPPDLESACILDLCHL